MLRFFHIVFRSNHWLGALFALVVLLAAGAASAHSHIDDGRALIRGMGNNVFAVLGEPGRAKPAREARFRAIYRAHFDRAGIAAFVVGRPWRAANAAERDAIFDLFEIYAARFFAAHLADYAGAEFHVLFSAPDGDGVEVSSQIVDAKTRRNINVKWRLQKSGQGYAIRDVLIENISMSLSLRRELATLQRERGETVDGVIAVLRGLVETLGKDA